LDVEGFESNAQMYERIQQLKAHIKATVETVRPLLSDEVVLLISHSKTIRALFEKRGVDPENDNYFNDEN
jgi:broad specificity phosphatase PhoE